MAVTLESSTQDVQEMQDALTSAGLTVREESPAEPVKPAADEKKSPETTEAPGATSPAETEVEAPAAAGAVEETTQETPQEPKEPEGKKSKGGFQAKVEKLTRRVEDLQQRLEEKDGNEAFLRRQLEEARAELSALKPQLKEEDKGPVRPKRPTRAEVDFDEDKYEAAMAKYDDELEAYHAALRAKDKAEAIAEYRRTSQLQAAEAAFLARRNADAKTIPDFDAVIAMLPEETETSKIEIPPAVMTYMMEKSQHPAKLMYFLAKDYLENDSEALNRISGMDAIDQLLEIREIERDLVAKAKAAEKKDTPAPKTEAPKAPATEAAPKPEAPAKPKQKAETLGTPIEPVGARAAAVPDTPEQLAERAAAGDQQAAKALARYISEVQAAKHNRRV